MTRPPPVAERGVPLGTREFVEALLRAVPARQRGFLDNLLVLPSWVDSTLTALVRRPWVVDVLACIESLTKNHGIVNC